MLSGTSASFQVGHGLWRASLLSTHLTRRRGGLQRARAPRSLLASGHGRVAGLDSGYHTAFVIGALFAGLGATIGSLLLRTKAPAQAGETAPAAHGEVALADAAL
jgi:hypothetical protein